MNSDMTKKLKKIARLSGFVVLAISIYFSYDGFDQSVSGSNNGYTILAILIGVTLAIVVSVMQFIFGTSYGELNWTLRIAGIAAYGYSIYTNYLGIKNVLGADDFMAIASALFMDIFPEPAIAWSMGEALTGDLFGNIGKIILGDDSKPSPIINRPPGHRPETLTYPPVGFKRPDAVSTKKNHSDYKHTSFGSGKPVKPNKVISNIFNPKYTDKFKK